MHRARLSAFNRSAQPSEEAAREQAGFENTGPKQGVRKPPGASFYTRWRPGKLCWQCGRGGSYGASRSKRNGAAAAEWDYDVRWPCTRVGGAARFDVKARMRVDRYDSGRCDRVGAGGAAWYVMVDSRSCLDLVPAGARVLIEDERGLR